MNIQNVEVRVVINDHPVKEFAHDNKLFVEAKDGSEYTVKIKNNNNFKILAVVAVDGIDIQNGQTASHDGPGYVINGLSSYEIKGYRKSLDDVGAFKFVKKEKSYSKEVGGGGQNCGIVSVAIFAEKSKPINQTITIIKEKEYVPCPVYPKPYWTYLYYCNPCSPTWTCGDNTANGAGITYTCNATANLIVESNAIYNKNIKSQNITSANYCQVIGDLPPVGELNFSASQQISKVEPSFDLGSTWGKKVEDKVVETTFERGNLLGEFNIFYASKESLKKMGVKMDNEAQVSFPSGFPGHFAKAPSGWKE